MALLKKLAAAALVSLRAVPKVRKRCVQAAALPAETMD